MNFVLDDECALNLFYQLSIDDDAKAMVTFTDVIPQLLERVLSGEASQTHIAILVNIATEKRNAQLICGREGKGLDAIMGRAIEQQNLLLFKLLRNLASHTGSTQIMFSKWVQKLLCLATGQTTSPPASLSFRIGVESIRILSQLHLNNWDEFIQKNNMVSWVGDKINTSQGKNGSTDLLLQVVILSGTMALQSCAARLLVPLVDSFLRFLAEEQEDDEMVIQIVYFFYSLLLHEETNADLTSEDSPVGAYLIDLMHDKNEKIRELCERTLDLFAMTSDVWSRRMDAERFCWHNAQWLEMVTGNDCTMSCDSALSEPPSLFNDIFETEELAEMN
ncbi:hypothetical protein AB6A40_002287 [Gnathostoma spinigerum]|uniref:Uncharacterized protein n=1 Tax=Gnathostoma spinigerum TaxID=75299 RepID=A0ABD6E663_9BILA